MYKTLPCSWEFKVHQIMSTRQEGPEGTYTARTDEAGATCLLIPRPAGGAARDAPCACPFAVYCKWSAQHGWPEDAALPVLELTVATIVFFFWPLVLDRGAHATVIDHDTLLHHGTHVFLHAVLAAVSQIVFCRSSRTHTTRSLPSKRDFSVASTSAFRFSACGFCKRCIHVKWELFNFRGEIVQRLLVDDAACAALVYRRGH